MSETKTISGGPPVPSPTLVQTDQSTILGDGSHGHPLRAGSSGGVSVDGTTILGNGTPGNPLHAGPADGTFRAAFSGGILLPVPGMPGFMSSSLIPGGITTVQPPSVGANDNSSGQAEAFATVAGLVASVNVDGTVQFLTSGLLTLTTAQWDVVTGGSGGLVIGGAYYPSSANDGTITDVAPSGVGQFATRIGNAVNATTMLIQPSQPRQNLADLIVFARFAGQPLILGSAVVVSGANHVDAAVSNVSLTASQAIGVIAALDINSNPIVQLVGVVTLTTAQWDAVTDTSPGMQAGTAYYVDTNASPGHLTSIAPLAGSETQVGVGLSTTQMILAAPFPFRIS